MSQHPAPIDLGYVDAPDGILLLLDPGLARFWRHDGDPASPRKGDEPDHDLVIEGEDAKAAGRAYDRAFDPLYLYDRPDPEAAKKHFDEFAAGAGFAARAKVLDARIHHIDRAHSALASGKGLAITVYNGIWGVVAEGLPTDRPLKVQGVAGSDVEFGNRWKYVDVIVAEGEPASTDFVEGAMVDHGQLMFSGLQAMGAFKMWQSLDGLADFVFWGDDAEKVAAETGAAALDDGQFGWLDVPLDEIGAHAQRVQKRIADDDVKVGSDYRPHCNLGRLNAALRESEEDAAEIVVDGARMVGFGTRWGDGLYRVTRHLDAEGNVLRLRVEMDTPQRRNIMRTLRMRSQGCIVTLKILDDGEPVQFAERLPPHNPSDSGWCFSAGTETESYMNNSDNMELVRMDTLTELCPEFRPHMTLPVGTLLRREGDALVEE